MANLKRSHEIISAEVRRSMKRMLCVLCATALSAVVGVGNLRAQQPLPFRTYGPSLDKSCGSVTASSGPTRETHEWWLLGFVSGASLTLNAQSLPIAATDSAGLIGAVSKYC